MRRSLRKYLGKAYRFALGPADPTVMGKVTKRHTERWIMFVKVADFVNYEAVPGDILEFGVFGGVSLALLAEAHECDPKGMSRRIAGFDSFHGLPKGSENHSRWNTGDCSKMHEWHPLLRPGESVSKDTTLELFRACELDPPELEVGMFDETIPATIPAKYSAAAVVHIDCDLYESTKLVLNGIAPILQEGTVLMFDEWFAYKGDPQKGEAHAFHDFLEEHQEWGARHYHSYSVFCDSFIMYRK